MCIVACLNGLCSPPPAQEPKFEAVPEAELLAMDQLDKLMADDATSWGIHAFPHQTHPLFKYTYDLLHIVFCIFNMIFCISSFTYTHSSTRTCFIQWSLVGADPDIDEEFRLTWCGRWERLDLLRAIDRRALVRCFACKSCARALCIVCACGLLICVYVWSDIIRQCLLVCPTLSLYIYI